ncbi:MAG: hypothetical protein ACO1N7_12255 [Sphingobacteriaceae bacterium]
MKLTALFLTITSTILFSCNHSHSVSDDHAGNNSEPAHNHNEAAPELSQNNGAKWQTDKNTQIHVASLKAKLDAFSASDDHKIAAYHILASDLSKELKELISNCKMEGKAHDALHLWLAPVLKDVENLQNVTTTDLGKNTLKHLNNSMKEFNNYFI